MKTCPTCGKVVPRGHGFKSDRRYCNYSCYRKLPPKMVEVQETFGQPVKETILEILNENQNTTVTSDLLGISKASLYQWMEKLEIKKVLYWE